MKLINHLKTINKHKCYVTMLCFKCGLYKQGILHDLSKYSPTELKTGAKYWVGTRSPNSIERETIGYSSAWLHHKGRNRHHYEYWIDYSSKKDTPELVGMKMPLKYVIEMFCDRVAASKTYNKEKYTDADSLKYYMRGRGHYVIHPDTDELLHKLLEMLAQKGEDETFSYIKKELLTKKGY